MWSLSAPRICSPATRRPPQTAHRQTRTTAHHSPPTTTAHQLPVNDVLTLWDSLFEAWPIDDVAPPLLTAVVAAGAVGSKEKLMSCSNAAEAMAAVLSPGVPLVSGPYTDDGVEVRHFWFCRQLWFCVARSHRPS